MSPTLIATLAGLTTALCWGTSDYLSAKGSKKHGPIEINFVVAVVGLLIAAILFILYGAHVYSGEQLLRIGLSDFFLTLAYLLFLKALSTGSVGIIVPLGNIYPLFTILFSIVFLNVRFGLLSLLAMAMIVLGSMVLAYEKNHRQIPFRELHRETALALLAAIVWGLSFFVLNPMVRQVTWQTISIIGELFAVGIATLLLVIHKRSDAVSAAKQGFHSKPAIGIGLIGVAGTSALYLGSNSAGSVAIPTVLSAAGPLIAAVWAALIDHEKIGAAKRLGAVIVVAGIIVLNVVN